ncbi:MAG TPA: TadE/TadG family type IV pilus assembly protein [Acidobacteriaceae bacterium]|nr:TadE/TadG family type IV pilus assembly protein [Acidobacteriaceae bacterium]
MRPEEMRRQEPTATSTRKAVLRGRLRGFVAHDESGSALAEMVIVVPLMMLMISGLVWFGIALNNDLALNNAVQAGAEQLVLLRGNSGDPCAATVAAVENAAPGLATSGLTFAISLGSSSYTTSCSGVTMTSGETATLTVTYPVTINVVQYGSHTYTLSATSTGLIQ